MSISEWGNALATLLIFAFVIAAAAAFAQHKRRAARYLIVTALAVFYNVKIWFWQFQLTERSGVPLWYILNAVIAIVLFGIVPLTWLCFQRFRPGLTALLLGYTFSLLLQFFSYMYWANGTAGNFSVSLTHLDSFYFALGTLTTAGTGNISAISETARGLQTLQMGLGFALVGFAVALVLARYSNLFNRPRAEVSHDGVTAAEQVHTPNPPSRRRGSAAPRIRVSTSGIYPNRLSRNGRQS